MDNAKEFLQFMAWAKGESMIISPGHYIMQIARTIHIDVNALKELWTEVVNTIAYITNRLTRLGGEALIVG
ncbi:hypothetical protein N7517_010684 [Penicillium concentricum]|uniref:Uncharacterized protein n=1 Tax=Penicillium concentricum TaxID=293559 RepID=A0A9W9R9A3_9EURO|nr:uncharacterized protein N7517_010684 [Penicillium concentricum]KAJ5356075.1 hypothetical protein N7517_010684 [Penicillium concentricum]